MGSGLSLTDDDVIVSLADGPGAAGRDPGPSG